VTVTRTGDVAIAGTVTVVEPEIVTRSLDSRHREHREHRLPAPQLRF
jgi:hypothetical protein